MMSKRIITLTVIFFSILSISLLITQTFVKRLSKVPVLPGKVIIAFADHINYKSYDENGLLKSNISATSATTYQANKQSIFQQPHGLVYTKRRIPWYIRANHGTSQGKDEWVYLNGNVFMHQLPYPQHPETFIKTETMTIHPKKELAQTNDAVSLQQLGNEVKGVGMKANLNTGVINILSQSRGFYHPEKNTTSS